MELEVQVRDETAVLVYAQAAATGTDLPFSSPLGGLAALSLMLFLFPPLLPSVATGTLSPRSILQRTRISCLFRF